MTTVSLAHTDCGFSVSWEPAEDTGSCDEFSPASIKERWTDPEKDVLNSLVSAIQSHREWFKTHSLTKE